MRKLSSKEVAGLCTRQMHKIPAADALAPVIPA
jgi:hypothetical protein